MSDNRISLGPQPFLYPEPVLLVGVYDADGKANVMTAAWGGICCSKPVCLMVAIQPVRWTHDALLSRKGFTVSIPSADLLTQADYLGIASGRRFDKFAAAGLTPVRSGKVDAPYVGECPVILECALSHNLNLGMHTLMVGEILDVKAKEDCMTPEGYPDIKKIAPLIYEPGSRTYYGLGEQLGRAFSAGKALLGEKRDER
ncbi:flavin reductase family protein [Desulfovibrio sp. OttesenSCG-928-G11]|nr:flavin reductase family protein [Desulfovibrio sp. OttesenSCG-928-G11]